MKTRIPKLSEWKTSPKTVKAVFWGLVLVLFVIGVGHLYVLDGLTDLYFGLPYWTWVQLVVVFAMVGIAWIAVRLVAVEIEGGT